LKQASNLACSALIKNPTHFLDVVKELLCGCVKQEGAHFALARTLSAQGKELKKSHEILRDFINCVPVAKAPSDLTNDQLEDVHGGGLVIGNRRFSFAFMVKCVNYVLSLHISPAKGILAATRSPLIAPEHFGRENLFISASHFSRMALFFHSQSLKWIGQVFSKCRFIFARGDGTPKRTMDLLAFIISGFSEEHEFQKFVVGLRGVASSCGYLVADMYKLICRRWEFQQHLALTKCLAFCSDTASDIKLSVRSFLSDAKREELLNGSYRCVELQAFFEYLEVSNHVKTHVQV
jgi:hypothetical protein